MARGGRIVRSIRGRGLAALAAALLAALVAGCGGDDDDGTDGTVSAEAYVTEVCTSISQLTTVVQEGEAELDQEALATPEQGRDALAGFLGDAASAAEAAHPSVEGAGTPDVDDGEQAAAAVSDAIRDLRTIFEEAEAEEMETGDPAGFAADAQEIAASLQESGQRIQQSLAAVEENDELGDAAEDVEACEQL
jgi:hypothetical protein